MSLSLDRTYEFDSFSLDAERRLLLRNGEPVPLAPKVLETLLALIEDRGRILTKDELLQRIWGETIVEEGGLARNISILRKVLGEHPGEHRYIVTAPGKGYQFVAEVREQNGIEPAVVESEPVATISGDFPVPVKPHSRRQWQLLGGLAAVLVLGAVLYLLTQRQAVANQPEITSLAVLPLKSLSADPNQEYFADGLTEALIGNLAQIQALTVISRTSAMTYKNSAKPLPEIARELGVDAIVEGSVQRENGLVKVWVQLIYARTDAHLWARDYQRNLTDVLKLQAEIATTVAEEIRVQVTPDERTRLAEVRTVNPAAHDEYLIGLHHVRKFIASDHKIAITHFERATKIDSNYAAAWAGLAQAWWQLGVQGETLLKSVEGPARASAAKALELDDRLAAAHVAQGYLAWVTELDWKSAENSLRRAIELDPGDLEAHFYYARLLMLLARYPEAITQIQIAERLDPVSPAVQSTFGQILHRAGKLDEAVVRLERAVEREPRYVQAQARLTDVYVSMGRFTEALDLRDKQRVLRGNSPDFATYQNFVARVYALMNRRAEAKRIVSELGDRTAPEVYAALGEKTEAFRVLFQRAKRTRLHSLKVDPGLRSLHSDPRWPELLRLAKLPED